MSEPIILYDRYRRAFVEEHIYGERFLRLMYGGPAGRLLLFALIKRSLFSRIYGCLMSTRWSRRTVPSFIADYHLDVDEFADAVADFGSFNDFFSRRLKVAARPICTDEDVVVLPADGRHLVFPDISIAKPEYIKACTLDLEHFLGSAEFADRHRGGSMLVSRLAPVDYHRFHFPIDGTAGTPTFIDGDLYSVSPIALARVARVFLENKRWVTTLASERWGHVTFVEVGATNVGSVVHTAGRGAVRKGDEKGYFRFGGSTVVVLFQRGRVVFSDDLLEHSARGVEVYAKMGDIAGRRGDAAQ